MSIIIPESIENKIFLIRGQKVMPDRALAELYNLETGQLKRQVKRNIDRFPKDFMFTLNDQEINKMVCHFGTPFKSRLGGAKPFAFTEHGILMLSSVLNSKRAIEVNIQIMRTFIRLRLILSSHKDILKIIEDLENKYDHQFKIVFDAIKILLVQPEKPKRKIGFLTD